MGAALVALAVAAAMLATAIAGKPHPSVHDEFSYVLAADTFAHFRLANPTHPLWPFFESMHIVHQPSYASMYPPGQGMMLALGQIVGGDAVVGLWISAGLMTGVIYWMLLAWLPNRWAALGGLLVVLKFIILGRAAPPAIAGYWTQSYQGGAVAAIGGALLYGALARIVQLRKPGGAKPSTSGSAPSPNRPHPLHAVLLALGAGILANSRPFEGFLLCLPAALILLFWILKRRGPALREAVMRVILPATAVLVLIVAFMLHYNLTVTGKATLLPWQHHHNQYCTFPVFLWQHPKAAPGQPWQHEVMARFHGEWEVDLWNRHRSVWGLTIETARKLRILWAYYVATVPRIDAPVKLDVAGNEGGLWMWFKKVFTGMSISEYLAGLLLTLPLLTLPWVLRNRWMGLAFLCCAAGVAGNLITSLTFPHYAAPMTCLLVLLLTQCLRHTRVAWPGIGRAVFAAVMFTSVAAFAAGFNPAWREGDRDWHLERIRITEELSKMEGGHVVIVRPGPPPLHSFHNEWVFNEADIDGSKIIWARDMGEEKNRALLDYFKTRTIWLLEVNDDGARQQLKPYP